MDLKTLQNVQTQVEALLAQLGIDFVTPTVESDETNTIKVELQPKTGEGESEGLGLLIGNKGETLQSFEYILALMVNKGREEWYRVVVDSDGYRGRRDEELKQLAYKTADKVRFLKQQVELRPMSSADRRIVHMTLSEMEGIKTESMGEGRDRRIVVLPA